MKSIKYLAFPLLLLSAALVMTGCASRKTSKKPLLS